MFLGCNFQAEFWQEEVTRLKSIIQLFPINSTPLPLAIVSVTADNNDTCMALDYKTAQFHLQVSSYTDRLTSSSLFQISNVNSAAANDEVKVSIMLALSLNSFVQLIAYF